MIFCHNSFFSLLEGFYRSLTAMVFYEGRLLTTYEPVNFGPMWQINYDLSQRVLDRRKIAKTTRCKEEGDYVEDECLLR